MHAPYQTPKTGRGGPEQGEILLIATDRFDLDADVIALIFKHRWTIEIFFRFFKHVLGCRHLLSTCQNGIELQTYAAIIACMLIACGRAENRPCEPMRCSAGTLPAWLTKRNCWPTSPVCKNRINPAEADCTRNPAAVDAAQNTTCLSP